MRRAISVRLDIDESEIKVGVRVMQDATGQIVGQVFICDRLENGAGYSAVYGDPLIAEHLLRYMVGETTLEFYGPIADGQHRNECRTSCPDCLRDFNNLVYHNILDWRVALDMARLALFQRTTAGKRPWGECETLNRYAHAHNQGEYMAHDETASKSKWTTGRSPPWRPTAAKKKLPQAKIPLNRGLACLR